MYIFLKGKLMMKKLCYLFIFIFLFTSFPFCANAHEKPEEVSFSDFSGIISDGAKDYIKSRNSILFSTTGAKIIFVTTDSTNGISASEYAKSLYSSWNISSIGRGNSVLIVMSDKTKDYGIIQGKNIKRTLDDTLLYKLVSEDFEPHFAKGNYSRAVISLYNKLGKWYEENYNSLNLNLDDDTDKYLTSEVTKDVEKETNKYLIWIGVGVVLIVGFVFFKIKRHIDFKLRQQERKLKRKRDKANIDKIVNS